MKASFAIVFILAISLASCANGITRTLGTIATTDATLAIATVQQRFRLGRVVTATYTFTGATPTALITGIRIDDNKRANRSPAVAITAGALASNTITLQFTSQRGLGIYETVTVYGTP